MKKIRIIGLVMMLVMSFLSHAQLISIEHIETDHQNIEIGLVFDKTTEYKAFLLKAPNRLVIDFKNSLLLENIPTDSIAPVYIESIRMASRNKQDLRLVVDFKTGVEVEQYALIRDGSDERRLELSLSINKVLKKDSATASGNADLSLSHTSPVASSNDLDDLLSGWDISGKLSIEELGFFHNPLDSRQHNNYISGAFEPEIYREWDNGKQSFTFVPFYRYSQHDNKRTHFDIRELTWLLAENNWELRVGIRKVFWGVAEGLHLVNIINQTDLVENTDTEDKLGQPMINLALIRDWGTVDLFVLPGFRERTFPGVEGRLRTFPEVRVGDAVYEKHGVEKHLAFAARWSHVIGDWDLGLSHFYGTSREPVFNATISPTGSLHLIPYYQLINQTGLDLQLTYEDWIFKHEGIVRSGQGKTFYATSTGVEYTLFDLFRTGLDLGVVVEYMYDTRGEGNFLAPFQDDILTALRFAFNDEQSAEVLAGVMFDRTNNAKFYNIEASRRLGDSFKVEMEMRLYSGAPVKDPSYIFREDDHVRLDLSYHF
ncbi:MAG: AMIN domain-containing protein [Methylomarinum sp.]|nr:AMIN domain-containing protein [Methylomarinum sp.]